MVGAVESGSGGTGFDSRRVRVTFGVDFWSCLGDFFMALGMCGEWSGDVLRLFFWMGRVETMSKIVIFKNAWEYVSRVGGIKIRGLGILLDKTIKKSEKNKCCRIFSYFFIHKLPINRKAAFMLSQYGAS